MFLGFIFAFIFGEKSLIAAPLGDIFMRLLKMVIVPLIFTSITVGVASLGDSKSLGRMGAKTFGYYVLTSMLAIIVGLTLTNIIRPGQGVEINSDVELVKPLDEKSPVLNYLNRTNEMIYHTCWEVLTMDEAEQFLFKNHRVIQVSPPKPAILFNSRLVSFHYLRDIGLIEVLEMSGSPIKYAQLLKHNRELGTHISQPAYKIKLLSNITVSQLKDILEYYLRLDQIPAEVSVGNYDNIVQESNRCDDTNLVIIFWELCNLSTDFQFEAELMSNAELDELYSHICRHIDLVFKNLENVSLVLMNTFSALSFSSTNVQDTALDHFASRLNRYLKSNIPDNVRLVQLDKLLSTTGLDNSLDFRMFYSSRALYTIEFFTRYAMLANSFVKASTGRTKKLLIFDCDNTLWKGILGEDGFENIQMSSATTDGIVFNEIQKLALALNRSGILLGICSKNNLTDVQEVIDNHKDMMLRDKHITVNKSNWSDKVTNIRQIALDLNIGLNSIVFFDDSSFEVNQIRELLPEVTVIQVPEKLSEYPALFRKSMNLFYKLSSTDEDLEKSQMYKQQISRQDAKAMFANMDDYLGSLGIQIQILPNDESIIPRMSQLTQKTNQFNLTTLRYTENDIRTFVQAENTDVFAISVIDKFGNNGITGLTIIKLDPIKKIAEMDVFLLSCRVIGRNIEYAFMDYLVNYLTDRDISVIKASYLQTIKNDQVRDFYLSCGFDVTEKKENNLQYELLTQSYTPSGITYIEVQNG